MRKEDKDTYALLQNISSRLSGRADCRGIEYKVTITDKSIYMDPDVSIFPNRHRRSKSDRRSVLTHILSKMYNQKAMFVPGEYIYKRSINNRRRWMRNSNR